jgi:hypothetical protein
LIALFQRMYFNIQLMIKLVLFVVMFSQGIIICNLLLSVEGLIASFRYRIWFYFIHIIHRWR